MEPPDYTFDAGRLAALARYEILDTPPEPGFDDIVQLATLICDTPISLISLVDSTRQWFKARICFDADQTALDCSICAHALAGTDLLVIPDATQDDRTAANPLVTGPPHIRFYAGVPFRAATGEMLGSLCVIDTQPRPDGLTPSQTICLANLGRQVSSQLEMRRAFVERDLHAAERKRAEAQQEVLNEELGHRLKNTFAIIQAIATQTLREVPDQAPVDAFVQRLHALSAAHDVLLQKRWAAAYLGDVVNGVIATLVEMTRFDISGPEIELAPRATLSISLLLHELSTNAMKYGSLSNTNGRVRISWSLDDSGEKPELALCWNEIDGPPAEKPRRMGFGSKLIRAGLVGSGGVDLRYLNSGLIANFKAPLAQVQLS